MVGSKQAADLSEGMVFGVGNVERVGSAAESQALRPKERCFLKASVRQPGAAASDLVEESAVKVCDDDPVLPVSNPSTPATCQRGPR